MDILLVTLRAVHIVGGAFWVGAVVALGFYVSPAISDAGPDGGKVMMALVRRKFLVVVPLVGLFTILAGIALYWHDSEGFAGPWRDSRMGISMGIGAVLTIVAFILGVAIVRPAVMRAMAMMQEMPSVPEADRPAKMAEVQRLRAKGQLFNRIVAVMLLVAVLTMAVARYL